jgi:hypothetical protein
MGVDINPLTKIGYCAILQPERRTVMKKSNLWASLLFAALLFTAALLLAGRPAQADPPHCGHVPVGTVLAWYGDIDDLPRGFVLCDGDDGTPDLQGKFLMGANADYPPGVIGGQNATSHSHTFSAQTGKSILAPAWVSSKGRNVGITVANEGHDHEVTGITDLATVDNRPEFMAVHFVMCVGK